ncbi:hypothetical protein [Gimesia fumaroli]|uniref:Uncharacterized protein n=1 Tax=Gimesia fumaroli TaxID=2527976 RepID=A0A518IKW5_9PLAN|nr:hypothetical protein [Gimesia fumaroli]QDV53730.1 hypothetical protein Enr17x_58110 [Gimesia fumaroli]
MSQLKIFSLRQCQELEEFNGCTLRDVLYDAGIEGQESPSAMFRFEPKKDENIFTPEQQRMLLDALFNFIGSGGDLRSFVEPSGDVFLRMVDGAMKKAGWQ